MFHRVLLSLFLSRELGLNPERDLQGFQKAFCYLPAECWAHLYSGLTSPAYDHNMGIAIDSLSAVT